MGSKPHQRDGVEKTPFEMNAPHARKERPENVRKPCEDLSVHEFDPDQRRGGETGEDRSDLLHAAWTADVQKSGVFEEHVWASGEPLEEWGRWDDLAVGEEVISNAVVARFRDQSPRIQRIPIEVPPIERFVVTMRLVERYAKVVDDPVHYLLRHAHPASVNSENGLVPQTNEAIPQQWIM